MSGLLAVFSMLLPLAHAQTKEAESGKPKLPAETHQTVTDLKETMTTNHGIPLSDDQNSLKAGARGPVLLEDFVLREKITHFDHERIPERVVHARGSGAHGYFQVYQSLSDITKAAFLLNPDVKTEVFVRFSTVAGNKGSSDTARDVRGFAVKFYTSQGNYDLVGNNIPVFFIQDAMKFPDLIHAVKMEADRGFPQAASAHDTFYDFISLSPESMHMMMWVMSDRAIPRSFRMMEGFGVHTFKLVNAKGDVNFVKFHWRPKLGMQSMVWDEAAKVYGADPDFHRRDLWDAIERGDFPEWELGLQVFDQATADKFDFDPLDATKLIPEEVVPLRMVGKMVLNRNVDNFHSETEQVAFLPSNLVPGIEFSNDPLLQGRLFSYQDTQITRLGGPNFDQIPVNQPKGCPFSMNFQRDGIHQMEVPKGRVSYEPNSLDKGAPRENPTKGFVSAPEKMSGEKVRQRSETFADHYSQARMFFRSMTKTEQHHIIAALGFELGKVGEKSIRLRMLGQLANIDATLHDGVSAVLGMKEKEEPVKPALAAHDMPTSAPLSILANAQKTLQGRKIGVLISEGFDSKLLSEIRDTAKKEKATVVIIAPNVGGAKNSDGKLLEADAALSGSPSVLFDTVVILTSKTGVNDLSSQAAAIDFVRDAFGHCKVIAYSSAAQPLLDRAGVKAGDGVMNLESGKTLEAYITTAKAGRVWARETSAGGPG